MSLLDPRSRITSDVDRFHRERRSSSSKVYVNPDPKVVDIASIDLSVGEQYFESSLSEKRPLQDDRVVLGAGRSIVLYTQEEVRLPLNVFGVVSGKGSWIYHGIFISSGKIDPGFSGRLRIGLHNASAQPVILEKGELICSCYFVDLITHLNDFSTPQPLEPFRPKRPNRLQKATSFLLREWKWFAGILIAAVSAAAGAFRAAMAIHG